MNYKKNTPRLNKTLGIGYVWICYWCSIMFNLGLFFKTLDLTKTKVLQNLGSKKLCNSVLCVSAGIKSSYFVLEKNLGINCQDWCYRTLFLVEGKVSQGFEPVRDLFKKKVNYLEF